MQNGYTQEWTATASFNVTDLNEPVPFSIYSSQPWCATYQYEHGCDKDCPTTAAYKPLIVVPEVVLQNMNPAWASCYGDIRGVYDPPIALTQVASVKVPQMTDSVPATSEATHATPASSPSHPPAKTGVRECFRIIYPATALAEMQHKFLNPPNQAKILVMLVLKRYDQKSNPQAMLLTGSCRTLHSLQDRVKMLVTLSPPFLAVFRAPTMMTRHRIALLRLAFQNNGRTRLLRAALSETSCLTVRRPLDRLRTLIELSLPFSTALRTQWMPTGLQAVKHPPMMSQQDSQELRLPAAFQATVNRKPRPPPNGTKKSASL